MTLLGLIVVILFLAAVFAGALINHALQNAPEWPERPRFECSESLALPPAEPAAEAANVIPFPAARCGLTSETYGHSPAKNRRRNEQA